MDEFDEKAKEGGFGQEPLFVNVIIAAAVILLVVLCPPLIVLIPIWFAVYLGSAALARHRFTRWLDRCVAAHRATSQANTASPPSSTTSTQSPAIQQHRADTNRVNPNYIPKVTLTDAEAQIVQAALEPFAGSYLSPKAYSGAVAVALSEHSMSLVRTHMHGYSAAHCGTASTASLAIQEALAATSKAYDLCQVPVFLYYKAALWRLLGHEEQSNKLLTKFLALQAEWVPDQFDEAVLNSVCKDIREAMTEARRYLVQKPSTNSSTARSRTSYEERLAAITELERSSDPKAAASLRAALGDNDPRIRAAALRSLEGLVSRLPSAKLGATI